MPGPPGSLAVRVRVIGWLCQRSSAPETVVEGSAVPFDAARARPAHNDSMMAAVASKTMVSRDLTLTPQSGSEPHHICSSRRAQIALRDSMAPSRPRRMHDLKRARLKRGRESLEVLGPGVAKTGARCMQMSAERADYGRLGETKARSRSSRISPGAARKMVPKEGLEPSPPSRGTGF